MKKLLFASLLMILTNNLFSQFINSVQLNGGLIMPTSGKSGPLVGFKVNHELNETWSFYLSSGYSYWDRNSVTALESSFKITSYSEDAHSMIPIYVGTKMIISTIKTFQIFVNLEIGYNYLSYNTYQNISVIDEKTKKVTSFYADVSTKKGVSESFLGAGFGLGFIQKISDGFSFSVDYKRNSIVKDLDNLRHHYILNLGLIFKI